MEYLIKTMIYSLTVLGIVGLSWHLERKVVKGIKKVWLLLIPCCLATVLLSPNDIWGYIACLVWACESIALCYDVKYREVNDFNHIFPAVILLFALMIRLVSGFEIEAVMAVPILFIAFTMGTRGLSDTMALAVYLLWGIVAGKTVFAVLISFLIGYGVQLAITIFEAVKTKTPILEAERKPRAFLPALFIGSLYLLV